MRLPTGDYPASRASIFSLPSLFDVVFLLVGFAPISSLEPTKDPTARSRRDQIVTETVMRLLERGWFRSKMEALPGFGYFSVEHA